MVEFWPFRLPFGVVPVRRFPAGRARGQDTQVFILMYFPAQVKSKSKIPREIPCFRQIARCTTPEKMLYCDLKGFEKTRGGKEAEPWTR